MNASNVEGWACLVDPADTASRLLMSVLRLLVDKGLTTDEELAAWADPAGQELETEENARRVWHTTWLPTEELAAMVLINPDSLVLDAGCGFGGPARELAERFGCRVVGIDRDPLKVLHAVRQTRTMGLGEQVRFCWGTFERLPFPDETFDVVWAMESVTSLDTVWRPDVPTGIDPALLGEFRRTLRHGGQLACQLWIKGPVEDCDVDEFLGLAGFAPTAIDDCTDTWLACMQWSIGELAPDDPRRKSWQETHDDAICRRDRAYRLVATKG